MTVGTVAACHPERSEGPVAIGSEMLRGVYPERSEGLSMTGRDLSVDEELSRSFEPCLNQSAVPFTGTELL